MPKLKCKVDQCAYNKTGLCAKNYIDVDGPEASSKKETSCKSYLFKDVETSYDYEFATMDSNPSLQTAPHPGADGSDLPVHRGLPLRGGDDQPRLHGPGPGHGRPWRDLLHPVLHRFHSGKRHFQLSPL